MKILNKQYILDKRENITAEYIENHILNDGYEPLRWSIVAVNDKSLTIESAVIKN